MSKFESLTKYLPQLSDDTFGTWIIDRENDGTPEHPIQMPYVHYTEMVDHFVHDVYAFMEANEEFENNFPFISKIIFSIGGFFGGYETRTVTINGDEICITVEHSLIPTLSNLGEFEIEPLDKEEFMDELSRLYIGEWRRSYHPERFGYSYCDGTQWELEIQFSNGAKPFKCYGDNSYPYNFDKFQELLGIDTTEEPEEEEDE